jgi:hypothetical protein
MSRSVHKVVDKDVEIMYNYARRKVASIFKSHGLASYRKIGLQRSLRDAIVKAALSGKIDTDEKETFRHTS